MSDDRISESPDPPRCPVCATGFTATPGASCPACGRSLAPRPTPSDYDFRLRTERRRLDGLAWIVVGVVLSCCGLLLAIVFQAPGVLVPLGVLLVTALVRTARLARGREKEAGGSLFALFLAALGVSLLTGIAAGAACFAVCLAIIATDNGGGLSILGPAFTWGGVTALVVFIGLSVALWPRADLSPRHDHGED